MQPDANLTALPLGSQLHEFTIRDLLGRGGVGIVYAAEHGMLGEWFVIKEYLPWDLAYRDADDRVKPFPGMEKRFDYLRGKFLEEGRMLMEMARPRGHPNLVEVTDAFREHDTVYLCMRFEHARTLDAILASQPMLDEQIVSRWLFPLLDGLAHAHARNIWHRDIKPSNILIRDADHSPILIDFGAAHWDRPDHAATVITQYTPDFAAPEQLIGGHKGPWTDIYALAATWFYALTGAPPISGLLSDKWYLPHTDRFSLTFLEALHAGLHPTPAQRPQCVDDWRRQFDRSYVAAALPITPVTTAPPPHIPPELIATPVITAAPRPAGELWGMDTEALTTASEMLGDLYFEAAAAAGQATVTAAVPSTPPPAAPITPPPRLIPILLVSVTLIALSSALGYWYYRQSHGASPLTLPPIALSTPATAQPPALPGCDHMSAALCTLLTQFKTLAVTTALHPDWPRVTLNHPTGDYHDRDYFVLRVQHRGGTAGYLTLDYFDSDGEVVHLLPNKALPDALLVPDQIRIVGVSEATLCTQQPDNCFIIAPPYGVNLLIATWTPTPLFATPRPVASETAAGYVRELLAATSVQSALTLSAHVITTSQ